MHEIVALLTSSMLHVLCCMPMGQKRIMHAFRDLHA